MRSFVLLFSSLSLALAKDFNCVPGQPCWPSPSDWASFNKSIAGNLGVTVPLASSCYGSSPDYNAATCRNVEANYMNGTFRGDNYGNTQNLNWEVCGNDQCQINTLALQTPPVAGTCALGALSAYYVAATSADHVSKTLAFVDKHSLRLSIKNTGHDYFGRSVSPNSLALWTHKMKSLKYNAQFTANNCPAANTDSVGELGAGVIADEAVRFFEGHSRYLTVGAVRTVGIAGGFGLGGGHGPLAPQYGLAVDNAVEFDVVTPDGKARTINQCNDPDLFYAMRGGGGGTYAVLLNYKIKVHPAVPISVYRYYANITTPTPKNLSDSEIWPQVFETMVGEQGKWSDNQIAGYNFFQNKSLESYLILPSTQPLSHLQDLTKKWRDILSGLKGVSVVENTYKQYPDYSSYEESVDGVVARDGPVGFGTVEATRLIPRTLFDAQTKSNDKTLKNTFVSAAGPAFAASVQLQIYATTPANHPDNSATGVNPAWRGALWNSYWVGGYVMGEPASVWQGQHEIARNSNNMVKAITPGGGNYMNEGDSGEADWQQCFFGSNYQRLLSIKKRYDPQNMLNCYKCVGWNGDGDARYSCYGSNPQPTQPQGPVS